MLSKTCFDLVTFAGDPQQYRDAFLRVLIKQLAFGPPVGMVSKTALTIFFIFCTKFLHQNGSELTKPDFPKKSSSLIIHENVSKMMVFRVSSQNYSKDHLMYCISLFTLICSIETM